MDKTIYHKRDEFGPYTVLVFDDGQVVDRHWHAYITGKLPPRHTLPIAYHVSLDPENVDDMTRLGRIIFYGKMIFDSRR